MTRVVDGIFLYDLTGGCLEEWLLLLVETAELEGLFPLGVVKVLREVSFQLGLTWLQQMHLSRTNFELYDCQLFLSAGGFFLHLSIFYVLRILEFWFLTLFLQLNVYKSTVFKCDSIQQRF